MLQALNPNPAPTKPTPKDPTPNRLRHSWRIILGRTVINSRPVCVPRFSKRDLAQQTVPVYHHTSSPNRSVRSWGFLPHYARLIQHTGNGEKSLPVCVPSFSIERLSSTDRVLIHPPYLALPPGPLASAPLAATTTPLVFTNTFGTEASPGLAPRYHQGYPISRLCHLYTPFLGQRIKPGHGQWLGNKPYELAI